MDMSVANGQLEEVHEEGTKVFSASVSIGIVPH